MVRILPCLYVGCVLSLLGPGPVHADLIPFSYGTFMDSNEFQVSSPSYPGTRIILDWNNAPPPETVHLGGSQPLRLLLFRPIWIGPPPVGTVDVGGGVGVQLNFHDISNNLSGTAGTRSIDGNVIGGTVTGTVTGGFGSTLMLNFPVEPTTFQLGEHLYSVRIESTSISAYLPDDSAPVYMDVTINQVPEPSGLVLGAAAALGFGVRRWRMNAFRSAG